MKKIQPWMSKLEPGTAEAWPLGTLVFYGSDNRHDRCQHAVPRDAGW